MAAPISVAPIPKVLSPDTNMFITDGPFLETKRHISPVFGFWKLLTLDEAAWRRGIRPSSPVGGADEVRPVPPTIDYRSYAASSLLFLRLCVEKVVHHRDDDVHAACIRVTCVVLGKMANRDSERVFMSP